MLLDIKFATPFPIFGTPWDPRGVLGVPSLRPSNPAAFLLKDSQHPQRTLATHLKKKHSAGSLFIVVFCCYLNLFRFRFPGSVQKTLNFLKPGSVCLAQLTPRQACDPGSQDEPKP